MGEIPLERLPVRSRSGEGRGDFKGVSPLVFLLKEKRSRAKGKSLKSVSPV